jgi:type VI protein secretion system component Hcp
MSSIGGVPNLGVTGQNLSTANSPVATVQLGESQLSQVAQRLGVNTSDLAAANPHIADPAKLTVGQDIHLPQTQSAPVANPPAGQSGVAGSLPHVPLGDPMTKGFIQADLASKTQLSGPGASVADKHAGWVDVAGFEHQVSDPALQGSGTATPLSGHPAPPPNSPDAFNAFLNLDGIKGESQDDQHKDWIELDSFSFGATNTEPGSQSGGAGTGKGVVNLGDIKGESTDKGHKDWIEVTSFQHDGESTGNKQSDWIEVSNFDHTIDQKLK